MIELTLYSRPGCHLCDEMLAELEPIVSGQAEIRIVDISEDEGLSKRFGLLIPVLMHEGEELSRYHLDRKSVTELLARQAT